MKKIIINKCTICSSRVDASNKIDLPKLPITELLFKKKYKNKSLNLDQKLKYCHKCHHSFLGIQYDIEYFYNSNNYMTSSSGAYSGRFTNDIFLEFIKKNINKKKKYKILEIGANDLYLLKKFYKNISEAVTIDPCIIPDKKLIKIKCIKNFLENVSSINLNFKPDIIICGHTLEHIANPKKFLKHLKSFSTNKTKFFFQFPSCESLINRKSFDQIHHQHFNFFSVNSFSLILNNLGFGLIKNEICEHHYGSLMTYFKINSNKKSNNLIRRVFKNLNLKNEYREYKIYSENLVNIILNYIERGYKIYGIGAGLMLPLVNYQLKNILNKIDGLLDDDKNKIGRFFPNIKIKIQSLKKTDISKSLVIICSTASSVTTRKLIEVCRKKNANIIIVPSMSF